MAASGTNTGEGGLTGETGLGSPFTPWPEQDENGVDLTLIRAALRLSPTERIRLADRARRSALRVQEIGRQARAARRGPPPSA